MSDIKHTPGPWTAIADICTVDDRDFQVVEVRESGDFRGGICRLQSAEHIGGIDAAETLANGALITAAPDLLAALKQMRARYEDAVRSEYETSRGMPDWFAGEVEAADAAIAKAEGCK